MVFFALSLLILIPLSGINALNILEFGIVKSTIILFTFSTAITFFLANQFYEPFKGDAMLSPWLIPLEGPDEGYHKTEVVRRRTEALNSGNFLILMVAIFALLYLGGGFLPVGFAFFLYADPCPNSHIFWVLLTAGILVFVISFLSQLFSPKGGFLNILIFFHVWTTLIIVSWILLTQFRGSIIIELIALMSPALFCGLTAFADYVTQTDKEGINTGVFNPNYFSEIRKNNRRFRNEFKQRKLSGYYSGKPMFTKLVSIMLVVLTISIFSACEKKEKKDDFLKRMGTEIHKLDSINKLNWDRFSPLVDAVHYNTEIWMQSYSISEEYLQQNNEFVQRKRVADSFVYVVIQPLFDQWSKYMDSLNIGDESVIMNAVINWEYTRADPYLPPKSQVTHYSWYKYAKKDQVIIADSLISQMHGLRKKIMTKILIAEPSIKEYIKIMKEIKPITKEVSTYYGMGFSEDFIKLANSN